QRIGGPVPGAVEHMTAIGCENDAAARAPARFDEARSAVARRVCHQRETVHGNWYYTDRSNGEGQRRTAARNGPRERDAKTIGAERGRRTRFHGPGAPLSGRDAGALH